MAFSRVLVAALACLLLIVSTRQAQGTLTEIERVQRLRWAVLTDPPSAALAFCATTTATRVCSSRLLWRRDDAYVDLCDDLATAPPSGGAVSGEPRFRARRYYRIVSQCRFGVASWSLNLPPLLVTLLR